MCDVNHSSRSGTFFVEQEEDEKRSSGTKREKMKFIPPLMGVFLTEIPPVKNGAIFENFAETSTRVEKMWILESGGKNVICGQRRVQIKTKVIHSI